MSATARRRSLRGDAGFVAGLEGAAFGLLACLCTALLAASAWGAVASDTSAGRCSSPVRTRVPIAMLPG